MGLERKVRVGGRSLLIGKGTEGAVYESIVDMMRLGSTRVTDNQPQQKSPMLITLTLNFQGSILDTATCAFMRSVKIEKLYVVIFGFKFVQGRC